MKIPMYKHLHGVFKHAIVASLNSTNMTDQLNCEHDNFFQANITQSEQCQIAQKDCGYQYQFINMFEVTYCWMNGIWIVKYNMIF